MSDIIIDPKVQQMYCIVDVLDSINTSMLSMFDTIGVLMNETSSKTIRQQYINNLRNALDKQRRKLEECLKAQQKISHKQ